MESRANGWAGSNHLPIEKTRSTRTDSAATTPFRRTLFYSDAGPTCNPVTIFPSRCDGPFANHGRIRYTGIMEPATSGIPYIQLLACSKDGPPAPSVSAVTHAADFRPRPLAAGQLATLFGENLGPAEPVGAALDAQGSVETSRGGVQVLFDELEAPLFFVGEGQINLQIPYELAGRSTGVMKVVKDGVESAPSEYRLVAAAPGLFQLTGSDQVVAVFPDGGLNAAERPAGEGDTLILFATGGGVLAPSHATGEPASPPFGSPVLPFGVTIGGQPVTIDYFGAAPGFAGLLQLNVRMNASKGNPRVVLTVGDASSDPGAFLIAE